MRELAPHMEDRYQLALSCLATLCLAGRVAQSKAARELLAMMSALRADEVHEIVEGA
jgi:hypothetical protein